MSKNVSEATAATRNARRIRSNTGLVLSVLVAIGAGAAACSVSSSDPSHSSSASASTVGATSAVTAVKSGYTALTRDVHIMARPELDVGRVDPAAAQVGSVYLRPSKKRQADRDQLLADIQNPASPNFHKWLTPEQYSTRFGASKKDVARLTEWLASQGLTVDGPSSLGTRLGFHGTTAQVEKTFNTEMHHYMVNGKKHFATASAPQVPTELSKLVLGIHGLHDFRKQAPHHPKPAYKDPGGAGLVMAPKDFQVLYDTQPLVTAGTTGQGVNLVVVGQTFYKPADLTAFRKKFSVTVTETDILVPGTGKSAVNDDGDLGETELDLEWAGAIAPGANLIFVYTGNNTTNYGVDDAVTYTIEQGKNLTTLGNGAAQIISESYGSCEFGYPADPDIDGEIAAAANLEGITYVAASGDSGAAGCIEFGIGGLYTGPPASLPGVTAVGGTEFPKSAQVSPFFVNDIAKQYPVSSAGVSLETVWNDEADMEGAGGGGKSIVFPKPFYQVGITPDDGARDVPDVSLTASPANVGYECNESGTYEPVGGTSASTPSFSGILAMVNQAVAAKGGALGLGNVNPMLYALAKSAPTAFHDIVKGNNDVPCEKGTDPDCPSSGSYGGYSAGTGYDLGSGIGTIDANNLVKAWAALAPTTTTLATSVTTATVNTPVTLTATIASTGTKTMGGTVSFTFQTLAGSAGQVYAVDGGGGADNSWLLGTVPVTPGSGGGTASLTTEIPAGLYGKAYVVAMYNGDADFMSSYSAQSAVTVTGSTLAVNPTSITLQPGATMTFSTSGGAPPVLWGQVGTDTTCLITGTGQDEMEACSMIESKTGTDGFFQAGGKAGTINIVAVDTQGQEALVKVTVAGTPVDGGGFPMFDAGPTGGPGNGGSTTFDGGTTGGSDAAAGDDDGGSSTGDDSGTGGIGGGDDDDDDDSGTTSGSGGTTHADAGAGNGAGSGGGSSSSGCAVSSASHTTSSADLSGLGLLFGLVMMARKRSKQDKKAS